MVGWSMRPVPPSAVLWLDRSSASKFFVYLWSEYSTLRIIKIYHMFIFYNAKLTLLVNHELHVAVEYRLERSNGFY